VADFTIRQHDRLPAIAYTLGEDVTTGATTTNSAVNLTGSTVTFIMRLVGAASAKVNATATVVAATSGTVRYDWIAADTDTAGDYQAEWQVTDSAGRKRTFPTVGYITITVVPDLDNA
jgi:hypothetical protein